MASRMIQLCSSCGNALGNHCIKCGGYVGSSGRMAQLCSSCGNALGNHCIKCGSHT